MSTTCRRNNPRHAWTRIILAILTGALAAGAQATPARGQSQPPSGMPDSAEFGFGGQMDPWGLQPDLTVDMAAGIGLDWIGIEFDWARLWPEASAGVDLTPLNATVDLASRYNLHLLVSITHAPTWAMTPEGPDWQKTAMLVALLAGRYPQNLAAVELFPGANTRQGWGAPPNPAAYAALLSSVSQATAVQYPSVTLIAAGLAPLDSQSVLDDMDDLVFLQGLYAAGALSTMPVVSLQMPRISGEPMEPAESRPGVLRHYESVRQVMLANQHETGLIWITRFAWPEALQNSPAAEQIRWLNQALMLMKSQLYIGAALFDRLNPGWDGSAPEVSLLQPDGSLHPAVTAIGQLITLGSTGQEGGFRIFMLKKLVLGPLKGAWKGNGS